ncbi:MAG: cysS [Patescibacteria group bacterium]|nr:cysS [Patescibacteria group bacterium]
MNIHLTNTLSKKKEVFSPIATGKVGMYHCGPTVYWDQQIGNMRAMVMSDLIRRVFMYNGYETNFVRNYTDVGHLTGDNIGDADSGEDRMEKAAKRENTSPDAIADKYIKAFNEDIASLNVIPPTHATRATHYIDDMIQMVQELLDKGFAYSTPHAVYFDVCKFPDYTKLSGQKLDHLESGEGHGTVTDSDKKDPHDFALWFFKAGVHANALQTWESPFASPLVENGRGFPGWHIECSAMSRHHLGATFDVHMGGVEHIPIHHTNEIAQSECANGAHFVNYWLHNEHLLVDGKKMGKSEGNAYVMKDIIAKGFSPLALRYFFLQSNYRSKQNFTWDNLEASETAMKKLKATVAKMPDDGTVSESYKILFNEMVNDDFNLAGGLAVVWELLKNADVSDADKKATILDFDNVLGLDLDKNAEEVEMVISTEIQTLLDAREAARSAKDWNKSDEIRNEIKTHGFDVKDTDGGQKLSKI